MAIPLTAYGFAQWRSDGNSQTYEVDRSHYLVPDNPTLIDVENGVDWEVGVGEVVVFLMVGFKARGAKPVRVSSAEVVALRNGEVTGVWAVNPRDSANELIINAARYPPPYELHNLREFDIHQSWLMAVGVRRTGRRPVGSDGFVVHYDAGGKRYSSFFPYKLGIRTSAPQGTGTQSFGLSERRAGAGVASG